MNGIRQMFHTALRDDDEATVGLRALLGHSATPWGVFEEKPPANPDYKDDKAILIWDLLGGPSDPDAHGVEMRLRKDVLAVTIWCPIRDTIETAHARARRVLEDRYKVTYTPTDVDVHQVKHRERGPYLWDPEAQVHGRAELYDISYREVIS